LWLLILCGLVARQVLLPAMTADGGGATAASAGAAAAPVLGALFETGVGSR
jgi:hypothetical protein